MCLQVEFISVEVRSGNYLFLSVQEQFTNKLSVCTYKISRRESLESFWRMCSDLIWVCNPGKVKDQYKVKEDIGIESLKNKFEVKNGSWVNMIKYLG